MCGGKREAAPLHSLGKFQLWCLDVPLALALCFASLDFCRNVIPQQPGLLCQCYLCAWSCLFLGMTVCIKFQVSTKYFPQTLPKISNLYLGFFFLFLSNCFVLLQFFVWVQKIKVGATKSTNSILFIFFPNTLSATTEVFCELCFVSLECRRKEILNNKYAIKMLICISEIIWRKCELKMESAFTYRHTP